jgi:hypothetical protein
MVKQLRNVIGIAALAAVAGCATTSGTSGGGSTGVSMRTAPEADELACLRAVAGPSGANNRIVEVMTSETSEANNLVMVAVGDQRAPWRCLVKNGQVREVMFAGNEGML